MINGEVFAKLMISKKLKEEKDIITWEQSTQRRIQNPVEHQQWSSFAKLVKS